MGRVVWFAGVLVALQALSAQVPSPAASEPVTLRTYVNLVQIPVLVLTDRRLRAEPVAPERFTVSIDSGPRFAPKHVRQEGSDPIRLLLLMEATPATQDLIGGLHEALEGLAPALNPNDLVSVSVLHGRALSHLGAAPLTAETIERFSEFSARKAASAKDDGNRTVLWDGITLALSRFGTASERRVVVVVTDGSDNGSSVSPQQLRMYADNQGVALFALRERAGPQLAGGKPATEKLVEDKADALTRLTEQTGGLTLDMQGQPLVVGLARILRMVRDRYIVDFVRPSKLGAGEHVLDVRIRGPKLFVRWSGLGLPLPDPKIAADPNTLPSNTAAEPPVGTRRAQTQ